MVVLCVEDDRDACSLPLPLVTATDGIAQASVAGTDVRVRVGDGATCDAATGQRDDGRELTRLPARRLFVFTWQDDHGPETFWSPD